jgi:hypothetical protein
LFTLYVPPTPKSIIILLRLVPQPAFWGQGVLPNMSEEALFHEHWALFSESQDLRLLLLTSITVPSPLKSLRICLLAVVGDVR